mmetsp:Transcript_366/g.537  ORF Transcript_366/g.537 Transcript_366/m.537 type:complete len:109 (-) Transcript_366:299-625(-)
MKLPIDVTTRVVIGMRDKIFTESAKKVIGKGLKMSKKKFFPTSTNQQKTVGSKVRWTEPEREILTEKQAKHGNCWKTIASSLPGRTESARSGTDGMVKKSNAKPNAAT